MNALDKAKEDRRATAAARTKGSTAGVDYSGTDGATPKPNGAGLGFNVNSLQQIGAFVGQNRILFEARTQTATQKKMALSLSKIEGHLRTSGGGFLG